MPSQTTIPDLAAEARHWLTQSAAPLWAPVAHPSGALFPERMSIAGVREECPHRLFVQARHVFSYVQAGRMGFDGPWREWVAGAVDTILSRGRRADGFYVHKLAPDGTVFDARADLYDQAFVLLALAHAGAALGRPDFFEAATALDAALDRHWRLPHSGYFEGEIAQCPPYRQNPHMHLLEAFIALQAATGDARWRDKATHLTKLCAASFIDPQSGALLEYFDASLTPLPGLQGRLVEPGHCFEWAWLFEIAAPWLGPRALQLSDRLVAFARRFGLDARRGVVINEVTTDGGAHNSDARLWPQTERLKAALARYRRTRDEAERDEAIAAYRGLVQFLDVPGRGAWRDKLRADGSWIEEPAPGSSLYHISCALMELWETAAGEARECCAVL
jgi:mannose/cellobiose epimerase-like protein (N-acyl-D-glucosamine 2-epimerase family)